MSLRTPSKIVGSMHYYPYIVRFVTHGAGIKYSNIIKNLNRKPIDTSSMSVPSGVTSITHVGFTSYCDLISYPNINKGSMFQLIDSLPSSLVDQMVAQGDEITTDTLMKDGVVLTMFVYELTK